MPLYFMYLPPVLSYDGARVLEGQSAMCGLQKTNIDMCNPYTIASKLPPLKPILTQFLLNWCSTLSRSVIKMQLQQYLIKLHHLLGSVRAA